MPFFSVVIPTYNRAGLVQNTVLSVLQQTFSDFEIIVVDDGSNDGTADVLNNEFKHEKRFTLITQPNSERGAARNHGFRKANGRYVVFLDSDDKLLPEHLLTLYSKLAEQYYPDFIASKFDFARNGKVVPSPISGYAEGYYDYKLFLHGNPLACNVCVKKDNPLLRMFEEDPQYAIVEDWMFLIENLRNNKLFLIDKVTMLMTDHADRSMRSDNKSIIQKTWRAIERIEKNVGLSSTDKKELEAHGNYFSAIHSYLDRDKKNGISFLRKAINIKGWKKKYFVLCLKIVAGIRTVNLIKRLVGEKP